MESIRIWEYEIKHIAYFQQSPKKYGGTYCRSSGFSISFKNDLNIEKVFNLRIYLLTFFYLTAFSPT